MKPPPSEIERSILQVIDDAGVIRGSSLCRRARVDDSAEMLKAVKNLIEQRLIAVTGGITDERAAMEAYFSLVPSTRNLAKQAVEGR